MERAEEREHRAADQHVVEVGDHEEGNDDRGTALAPGVRVEDLNRDAIWSWPRDMRLFGNYWAVLTTSRMGQFVANSFLGVDPRRAGSSGALVDGRLRARQAPVPR